MKTVIWHGKKFTSKPTDKFKDHLSNLIGAKVERVITYEQWLKENKE